MSRVIDLEDYITSFFSLVNEYLVNGDRAKVDKEQRLIPKHVAIMNVMNETVDYLVRVMKKRTIRQAEMECFQMLRTFVKSHITRMTQIKRDYPFTFWEAKIADVEPDRPTSTYQDTPYGLIYEEFRKQFALTFRTRYRMLRAYDRFLTKIWDSAMDTHKIEVEAFNVKGPSND